MSDSVAVNKPFMDSYETAQQAGGALIQTAGTVDSFGMSAAAAMAMGPIGAIYLAAYGPAQASNLAATLLVGGVHTGIGAATGASSDGYFTTDGA